ncbi:NADP-dependent oxidoreductase domain-containing protein [Hygrophoropsis aurantiaca]|uniref:NADP-dependent oxidoreductase domain-containing protein n=1 Tax=Hygrophoropsis aurantiaca TaxID=72124 RepID=A0ACB8AB93_9AGAM|nr:NADP-dependent oxidoreductase domain-containing protein [Hygrophoropsis aurantiaca]
MSSRTDLLYGAGSFGIPGPQSNGARVHTVEQAQEIIDVFTSHGYNKIDTARLYGGGTSEEFIGQMDIKDCTVDTKAYPKTPGDFTLEGLRASIMQSMTALKSYKIHTFYLHAPDRSVPIEETLRAVNQLHVEGLFEEFGLSNYYSWEVAQAVEIAKRNDWIRPTVYQGGYNAIERNIETELIPCLRHYGIRFYAYSPLAGGLLVGKILNKEAMENTLGGRWDPKVSHLAPALHKMYAPMLPALGKLKDVLDTRNIRLSEAAQRWLQHHSALVPGDAVVIGASSADQLEANLRECEGGPLPKDVLTLMEEAWKAVKATAPHYAS